MNWTVRGQVLEIVGDRALVHVSGMMDDVRSDWIPVPTAMPQWAKVANGPVFRAIADIDDATELTFEYLRRNPNCLKNFTCRPIPKNLDWLLD
ncbi:MAG: hypothetical protein ACRC2V_12190 [Xenococcaceae cyanobacterium]